MSNNYQIGQMVERNIQVWRKRNGIKKSTNCSTDPWCAAIQNIKSKGMKK